ncbi:AI-2E family transporter [Portibacter marinus]|uniref:AI-2E family transporter n=1 Tax=Portibacter marinus TaxID=2898660 RepID=UPI001F340783|nr:AI-2E family transporter [Portibacter marinus]
MKKESAIQIKRSTMVMLVVIAASIIMYYGKGLLIPLVFGGMFAFLLNPIYDKLLKWRLNKYLSAIVSTLLILLFVVGLLSALGWQIKELAEQSDKIKEEMIELQKQAQNYIKNWFGINFKDQEEYAKEAVNKMQNNILAFIGGVAGIVSKFFLSLVYCILLLAERNRISNFFHRIFHNDEKAENTIEDVATVTQKYLNGKLIIIGILSVVYCLGFFLVGIDYAILLAVLAAFLTFIPFVGNLVGGLMACLITLATGGSMTDILLIVAIMSVAQVIESYILQPWIVGDNIDLNPLFSILTVVAFSIIWGAAGAILALPLSGMLKVMFDHLKAYQPLGYLMGTKDVDND